MKTLDDIDGAVCAVCYFAGAFCAARGLDAILPGLGWLAWSACWLGISYGATRP